MANTVTAAIPKVIAAGLPALRENAFTPRLMTSYSHMFGNGVQQGDSVTIPKGAAQTVAAVTPSNTPPSNTDHALDSVTLTVNTWRKTDFYLTDKELTQINADSSYVPLQMSEAFKAIGNDFDGYALGLYDDIYGAAGTPGTTPFASDATAWRDARKLLNEQLAPMGGRNIVLDADAEANAMNLAQFRSAEQRGSATTIDSGLVGSAMGATWHMNQNVPTHTVGTLTNGTGMLAKVNDASYTVGESTVDIDDTSLSGTIVVGDVFTVAGDSQQYTVTAAATASGNAISGMAFTPTSKVAWADNAVVTFFGGATGGTNHVANLAFHPQAFGYAFARPDEVQAGDGEVSMVVTDPISGIPIRVCVTREYYQWTWRLDVLFGVVTVRPEFAVRIAG